MKKTKPLFSIYYSRPLTGEQAFMTAELLESVVRTLWREFGDDMADFQGRVFPDDPAHECACYNRRLQSNDEDIS
jgi:hypothetical protein